MRASWRVLRQSLARNKWFWLVLFFAFVFGSVMRILVLASQLGYIDSNEAVVGLMAQAMHDGEIPVYVWGTNSASSVEAGLVSLSFMAFGVGTLQMKLVTVALSLVTCVLIWVAGRVVVGSKQAALVAAFFWIYPITFIWMSTKARGYFWIALPLLLIASRLAQRLDVERTKKEALALGAVMGLAWWTTPESTFILVPLALWLIFRLKRQVVELWPALAGFVVGSLPWLYIQLRDGWSAFVLEPTESTSYWSRLWEEFSDIFPVGFGLKLPYSGEWLFGPLGIVLFVAVVAAGVFTIVTRDEGSTLWATKVSMYPFLAAIPAASFLAAEPRYALYILPFALLMFGHALRHLLLNKYFVFSVFIVAALITGYSYTRVQDFADSVQGPSELAPGSIDDVNSKLKDRGVDHVYGDYWYAYRADFESNGEITASAVNEVRNQDYENQVKNAPVAAYVVYTNSDLEKALEASLDDHGDEYEKVEVDQYSIFFTKGNVSPETLGLI